MSIRSSSGTITRVAETKYKALAENAAVEWKGSRYVPTHEVEGVTARGVAFVFLVSRPELFPVGASCEVWGGGAAIRGARLYGTRFEGTRVDGRLIFRREALGMPEQK